MVQLWNTTTDKFVLTFLHILPFNIWNHSFQGTPDELLHLFPSGFLFEQTLAKGLSFLRMEKKKTKCWQIRASFQKCLAPLFSPIGQQISWHPRNQLHVKLDPITKLSSLCFEFWLAPNDISLYSDWKPIAWKFDPITNVSYLSFEFWLILFWLTETKSNCFLLYAWNSLWLD